MPQRAFPLTIFGKFEYVAECNMCMYNLCRLFTLVLSLMTKLKQRTELEGRTSLTMSQSLGNEPRERLREGFYTRSSYGQKESKVQEERKAKRRSVERFIRRATRHSTRATSSQQLLLIYICIYNRGKSIFSPILGSICL